MTRMLVNRPTGRLTYILDISNLFKPEYVHVSKLYTYILLSSKSVVFSPMEKKHTFYYFIVYMYISIEYIVRSSKSVVFLLSQK